MSKNVLSGAGRIKWMVREESRAPADNGWRIFSDIDTSEYLHDADNLAIADVNSVCELEPALIGIWDLPVGSDLQVVDEGRGIEIVDTATGQPVPADQLYVPASLTPQERADMVAAAKREDGS